MIAKMRRNEVAFEAADAGEPIFALSAPLQEPVLIEPPDASDLPELLLPR